MSDHRQRSCPSCEGCDPGRYTQDRIQKDGESRVVRGGSCDVDEDDLRAAYRNDALPDLRFNDIGGVVVWPSQDSA